VPESAHSGSTGAGGPVRLSELTSGQRARLFRRELSEGEACLLAAMGLTEGCFLEVRIAGDPFVVEVRATRIGIARTVADRLLVVSESGGAR
jgi:Fe2+ transport system protein FeoA